MSIEAVLAVLSLIVGVPQGIVAVRQLRAGSARQPAKLSRWGVAFGVSSAVFLTLGVGTLIGLALAPEPGQPAPTAQSAPGTTTPTSTQAPTTTTTTTTMTQTAESSAAPVATTFDMLVPPPGCGGSAGVDVHLDDPARAEPGEKESAEADLEYDDCDGGVYPGSNGSAGLFTGGTTPTREECEAAALRSSLGGSRSIHTMQVGNVLCVVTDEDNVAAAVITKLGAPWGDGPIDGPRQPSISLHVTRWSPPTIP